MPDIQITEANTKVVFWKRLWDQREIFLAQCLNFHIDPETNNITASIVNTWKDSLKDFIGFAFKNFSESIHEQPRRDHFWKNIDTIYNNINDYVKSQIDKRLPYASRLYEHQVTGIRFSYFNRCTFLAYEMRLGKSLIAASLSRLHNVSRTIVFCPASAKMGWFRNLTTTWGYNELYFTVLDSARSRSFHSLHERFVIINYDIIDKYIDYLLRYETGHIIIDEAHRIKSHHSRRFKNVFKVTSHFSNAKITFLSGSPIPNRFNDLFSYFKIAGHPLGDSYKKFVDEYTTKVKGVRGEKITGAKNISDLRIQMGNFMLVKRMKECLDMPDDIISRFTFKMDDYRPEYERIITEMAANREKTSLNGSIHSLNRLTCKSKIKGIIDAIEDIIEETGKIVVFGTYKEPLSMLEEYFGARCLKVVGGVSSIDRDKFEQRFHKDESIQVFLANFEAGGEALDLSAANDVMLINFPFTIKEHDQAVFRIKHPEKRDAKYRIHYTFCEDSVDEPIYDLVINKKVDVNELLHSGEDVIKRESITEVLIANIISKRYNSGI